MLKNFIGSAVNKIRSIWSNKKSYDRFILIVSLAYLIVIGVFLILHQAPYAPDQFFVLALIFVLFTGQAKRFITDWTPFILFILAYEYVRSIVPKINPVVHYEFMVKFDTFIFGRLPITYLQHLLFSPGYLHWYDYASALLYSSYYVVPLLLAYIFWMTDRPIFEDYMFSVVGLSFMGFITYLVYPAAPPWLASQQGLISPPVIRILGLTFQHFLGSISLPTVYQYFGANLTAAVPSLHAAFGVLTALFVSRKYPKLSIIGWVYAISISFAVIYLGEHYFFDVLLGAIYAILVYLVVVNWGTLRSRFRFNPR